MTIVCSVNIYVVLTFKISKFYVIILSVRTKTILLQKETLYNFFKYLSNLYQRGTRTNLEKSGIRTSITVTHVTIIVN